MSTQHKCWGLLVAMNELIVRVLPAYSPRCICQPNQAVFLSCFIHQTQPGLMKAIFTKLGSNSTCNQIDRNTSPPPSPPPPSVVSMLQNCFPGSHQSGGMYRQLLGADAAIGLWVCKIDTVVVTKHNRKLLWGAEGFECPISQSKRWPEIPGSRGVCLKPPHVCHASAAR